MKEETVSTLVRLLYRKKPARQHSQRTPDCPPLTAFPEIVENGWPADRLDHIRAGCIYCEKVLVMQLRVEHPKPQALVSALCLLHGTEALKAHIEQDDCRQCRHLCQSEFAARRMACWRQQPRAISDVAPVVFGHGRRLRQAVAGGPPRSVSERHVSDDGRLVTTLWKQPSEDGQDELWVRVLNPGKEYAGRTVLLELMPLHGAPVRER